MSAPRQSEAHFQRQVEQLAAFYGWDLRYHTHDSRRSHAGFPDLVLVRGPELLFVELKTDRGRVRPEQAAWRSGLQTVASAVDGLVGALARATGAHPQDVPAVEVHLWRPRDFDELHARLARGRHRTQPLYRREVPA